MAYRPRTFQVTSAAQEAVNYDKDRTSLIITNLSGETIYMGGDPTITVSGITQGSPIFSNGRYTAAFYEGRDPRVAIWLIGSAGGQIIIDEQRI